MQPGDVVAERFDVDSLAGTGGMGTVFRARDRATGGWVAIKLVRNTSEDSLERFGREIRVLATLRHPHIVRYVADGRTPAGEMWLAMEWLDGETLSERLVRTGLTPVESVEVARRVAEALGVAHAHGIVHRDIKPSNLFLVGGDLTKVRVLDFGIARIADADRYSTRTGAIVGTPGYLAPEQARGHRDVGPPADVFSTAVVLFECLTGQQAFVGENVMAVLAKILLEDAPRLAEVRPELPEELDALVARALAKRVDARPKDGAAFAAELAALGAIDASARAAAGVQSAALTATERRLLCVVLIEAAARDTIVTDGAMTETMPSDAGRELGEALLAMREAASAHGASLEPLVDGSYVVTLAGSGSAGDQAMAAARCALALKALAPDAPMALATGRGVMAGRWPVGEAIDRAARLVRGAQTPHLVRIDDVTAGLLDTRFEVGGDGGGLYLVGERDDAEAVRTVLGKPTPCVGRDRELGVLQGLFDECVSEPVARVVLLTGAAGIGKSRVRFELLQRIAARGEPVEIWSGRGDPLRAGSPFGLLAPALRRAAGIHEGEKIEVRRQKLRARVQRNASMELVRTTLFLGELIGTPFPDDESVPRAGQSPSHSMIGELRAARQDPLLMNDQVRRAFEHFLALETSVQPVLIVLEDLHWGDLPTVKLIDATLRALHDRPLMVLALARPDVHELFPRLWAERGVQEVRLDELTKKGSERLVRRVLGESTDERLVARLVEQAGGNAFYLEELIRATAEGKGDAMPETVLAVVQGRLERLEVDARRVLRAASVFGQNFWRGGVTALLGGATRETSARAWIDELVERELVAPVLPSRFADDQEYAFRHALVRQAAYAMLTDGDRKLGHQLAGDWLEKMGEGEPMVLAEHLERADLLPRAVPYYLRAAERALAACDFRAAEARAQRGINCGAKGETLGALRLAQAEACKWSGAFAEAGHYGLEAMMLLPEGSARWFAAAGEAAEASGKLGDVAQLTAIGEVLRAVGPRAEGQLAARVAPVAHAAFQLFNMGRYELASALLDQVERSSADVTDPGILARVHQVRSQRAMFTGDVGAYLLSEQAAAREFERAGDLRYACMQRGHVGYACLEIGAFADAEMHLRAALADGTRLGLSNVVATAKHNLGRALHRRGLLAEAHAVEAEAVEMFRAQGDRRLEAASRFYLGEILFAENDLDAAESEIRLALSLVTPPSRPSVLAGLAQLLLARHNIGAALEAATEAHDVLEALGSVEEGESSVRLTYAACLAAARSPAAPAALARARARLLDRASRISNAALRASFLTNLPENAATLGDGFNL